MLITGILFLFLPINGHVILEPRRQQSHGTNDVIFIIFPQLDVPANAYTTLGRLIQDTSPKHPWVGIVEGKTDSHYEVDDVEELINDVTNEIFRLKGSADKVDIILGGHGHSGSLVQNFVFEHPNSIKGLVLMGTHIMLEKDLLELNAPAITIAGDIDGVTKITTLAKVYEKFIKEVTSTPSLRYRYPLVILDGVNHGIYSNGYLSSHLLIQDIPSDSDTKKLLQDIAYAISTFITYCEDNNNLLVLQQIDGYLKDTDNLMEPLLNANTITSSEYQSYWVKQSQMYLSDLIGPDSTRINVESYFTYQSAFDPALFNESPTKVTIYLFSQLHPPLETSDSLFNEVPSQIHARMFRRDRILEMLGMNNQSSNATERTCKDLNYASYLIAYYTSAERVRKRFDQKHPGIIFHDDIIMPSEDTWEEQNILVTRENDVLHVTSYAYVTENVDNGYIFCTLFPPIRAMEWIYYGIFK